MITNVINRLFNNLTRLSICHTLGLHPIRYVNGQYGKIALKSAIYEAFR